MTSESQGITWLEWAGPVGCFRLVRGAVERDSRDRSSWASTISMWQSDEDLERYELAVLSTVWAWAYLAETDNDARTSFLIELAGLVECHPDVVPTEVSCWIAHGLHSTLLNEVDVESFNYLITHCRDGKESGGVGRDVAAEIRTMDPHAWLRIVEGLVGREPMRPRWSSPVLCVDPTMRILALSRISDLASSGLIERTAGLAISTVLGWAVVVAIRSGLAAENELAVMRILISAELCHPEIVHVLGDYI